MYELSAAVATVRSGVITPYRANFIESPRNPVLVIPAGAAVPCTNTPNRFFAVYWKIALADHATAYIPVLIW